MISADLRQPPTGDPFERDRITSKPDAATTMQTQFDQLHAAGDLGDVALAGQAADDTPPRVVNIPGSVPEAGDKAGPPTEEPTSPEPTSRSTTEQHDTAVRPPRPSPWDYIRVQASVTRMLREAGYGQSSIARPAEKDTPGSPIETPADSELARNGAVEVNDARGPISDAKHEGQGGTSDDHGDEQKNATDNGADGQAPKLQDGGVVEQPAASEDQPAPDRDTGGGGDGPQDPPDEPPGPPGKPPEGEDGDPEPDDEDRRDNDAGSTSGDDAAQEPAAPDTDADSQGSLQDRIAQLRILRETYGDHDAIPDEHLERIGYARHIDAAGVTSLVPVERLGDRPIEEFIQERETDRQRPLFEELTTTVKSDSGYGTTVDPRRIEREAYSQLHTLFGGDPDELEPAIFGSPIEDGTYAQLDANIPVMIDGEPYVITVGSPLWGVDSYAGGYFDSAQYRDLPLEQRVFELLGLDDRMERYDSRMAEEIWGRLERLKSHMTDKVEMQKAANKAFYDMRLEPADPDEPVAEGPAIRPLEELSQAELATLRLTPLTTQLQELGFGDVAERLIGATTVEEVYAVLSEGARTSEKARDFREQEKALRSSGQGLTELEDPKQFLRDLSTNLAALKARTKAELAPLRAMAKYFDVPDLYAQYARRRISEVQKFLTYSNRGAADVTMSLDGSPDPEKDADPGAFSGDCTRGVPLPFDANVGAHNVKVYLGGDHKGNVYLLDTTDGTGRRVWHLDAIQIPSRSISWDTFPSKFIGILGEAAEAAGVSAITINKEPYRVSNYDYIGRAFLRQAGIEIESSVSYGPDEIPDDVLTENIPADVELTDVNFPPQVDEYHSPFQGEATTQIVIWSGRAQQ